MGEDFPQPRPSKMVMFVDFHVRGLGFPVHNFFHGLLHVLGIELQHLNPNGVLQVAGFVVVCEGFLGINPHASLFLRVFEIRTRRVKK